MFVPTLKKILLGSVHLELKSPPVDWTVIYVGNTGAKMSKRCLMVLFLIPFGFPAFPISHRNIFVQILTFVSWVKKRTIFIRMAKIAYWNDTNWIEIKWKEMNEVDLTWNKINKTVGCDNYKLCLQTSWEKCLRGSFRKILYHRFSFHQWCCFQIIYLRVGSLYFISGHLSTSFLYFYDSGKRFFYLPKNFS